MLTVKAFHVIFMVTWFAGLFYLPRLFVYHCETGHAAERARFEIMERRLFVMMTIGATGTALLGIWLLIGYAWQAYASSGWLHLKLTLVALLAGYHLYLWRLMRQIAEHPGRRGARFYRWINEVPSAFLVVIVLLAVTKPF
ncbi:CopD family protein [Candidatus Macondimonas diazotrophica]|jgi:putative membrane protein|uniref:Protoporphyrinogen IX oxidase n=1 Tax=Candidatus Macondimonas diazotrophica TaxID=2305248 RepID=A0A4Z0FAU3_9GAMM|nr:CopD family protein [Candidatus Macondimonas diazotrophica]NCU01244.1 CopD family protein [Candidatus Macondimonas diazotrophica]TFZ82892.1 CopD family protein [Candidatus Macondimonas diazotrophica]